MGAVNWNRFSAPIYVILFLLFDMGIVGMGAALYSTHRYLNRLAIKPKFRLSRLCAVVTPAPLAGVIITTAGTFLGHRPSRVVVHDRVPPPRHGAQRDQL